MKKLILLPIILLLSLSCVKEQIVTYEDHVNKENNSLLTKGHITDSTYYWASGKKRYLSVVPDKYFVIFDESIQSEMRSSVSVMRGKDIRKGSIKSADGTETYFMAKADIDVINAYNSAIRYTAPYLSDGLNEMGLTDRFYIKLKSASDEILLNEFAQENNLRIINENFLPLWFTLECTNQSKGNSLELANLAYESGKFAASDISLLGRIKGDVLTYNDSHWNAQWNLSGTYGISFDGVPQITTGESSVKVAVVDNGIRLDHPDMPITYSWDATTGTSPGRLYYDEYGTLENHGTFMAGVIGAIPNNGIGIVGLAPDVSLLPISLDYSSIGIEDEMASAIRYAVDQGSQIISNSWTTTSDSDIFTEVFNYALNNGCVVLQSSGNNNSNIPLYPYSNCPEVIVVGNTDIDGERYDDTEGGSNYGAHLDVVAPGTDIVSLGASSDYLLATGTSQSCAQVAAVAALMLSVNNDLTQQDIIAILEKTARKLPDYDFTTVTGRPNGTWNNYVGYGLVDCFDAIMMAKELDQGHYISLMNFDYSGSDVVLEITANSNIAVIWNWDTQDISYISAGSTEIVSHHYTSSGVKNIVIAECVTENTTPSSISTALKSFELVTGEDAYNFTIKSMNNGLENIVIWGGSDFATQSISFNSLTALENIQLINAKNSSITVSNCPNLKVFSNTRYVWGAPNIAALAMEEELLNPYVVGGSNWPAYPESVVSFASLNISSCPKLHTLSLENVGFSTISFSNLPKLQYVYLTSQANKIVGASNNPMNLTARGIYLKNAINTLPSRSGNTAGRILLRCVSTDNASYMPVSISSSNYNGITSSASNKNWTVIWNSGVQYQ